MPDGTVRSIVGLTGTKAERAATVIDSTVEVAAATVANTIYTMMRIPSRARIQGISRIAADVLDTTANTPTLDIGFAAVGGNITSDQDALHDGLDLSGSAFDVRLIKNHANSGKMAWEFVTGVTTDPGGFFDLTLVIKDATVNVGGTLTVTLVYNVD